MYALADIEWEAPLLEPTRDRDLERYVRGVYGIVPPVMPYFFGCPWIVQAMIELEGGLRAVAHIDRKLALLIGLVVSQDNSCRYCYAASRTLLKVFGLSETRIRRLEQDLVAAEVSPGAQLALGFARQVSRANPLPTDADLEPLRAAGFSDDAIKEIVFVAAVEACFNRLATLAAVPPESVERLAHNRLLGLLVSVMANVWKPRDPVRPGVSEQPSGPYAYLVQAFGTLPMAGVLARVIGSAWEAPGLTKRAKAFVLAVIARGLVCPLSAREAERLLVAEGVDAGAIDATLSYLASPILDSVEAAIIPFARETIWYRPAQIQRRGRVVRDALSRDQFTDLVGIAALANALCRMNVALLPG